MIQQSLAECLFPKARRLIFDVLFSEPERPRYLREIVSQTKLGVGHAQRELDRLTSAGIIRRFREGRHVYFQPNGECPVFKELRGIVDKTGGIPLQLQRALEPHRSDIRLAFVFGSIAKQLERTNSDVDVLIVGAVAFESVVISMRSVEHAIFRPVNVMIYSEDEFTEKISARHHFLTQVLSQPRIMLVGDADDLAKLSGQPVDPASRDITD